MAGAGPAVVNVKDWIHCNRCYTEPPKDRRNTQFIITSCGHLFCGKCYGEREKFCLVCKSSCSVVDLSKQVPPDVMIYFHTPESIIQRFIFQFERVSKFQREQRTRLVKHKIQKLREVAERKERELLLNEKENARLRQIKLNLESRSVSFPPSSSNSTTLRPPPSILRTGYGPIQTPPSFTRPHPSMTLPPSCGAPPSLADRPVGRVNTLTTFPMRGTNTPVTVSSDTRSFQPPPPPEPTHPSPTGGRRVTPRESGRVTSRPHPLQSSIRRSGSSGESTPYISPSIVSSAVARRPTVAMTPAVNDSAVLSCIRARAQERGGAIGGASRGGGGEKRKLETESMRPPSGKRVLNSLIPPGRLSIRTPPINGKMGVIRSSRLLSSASPRHEDAPMSVAPTSNQTTINERRLSAPLSLSAFQSQLGSNGSYSHQRPPLVKMSSPRYSLHSSPMINSIRL